LIIVPARQGHFFQLGQNSLALKQLAEFTKTPLPGLYFIWGWPKPGSRQSFIFFHPDIPNGSKQAIE
jgi:hypothetical protein